MSRVKKSGGTIRVNDSTQRCKGAKILINQIYTLLRGKGNVAGES